MSVRKRTWTTSKGEPKEAWIVTYTDTAGDRVQETFAKKKDATARHADIAVAIKHGTHVATSKSVTVAEAGRLWVTAAARDLERATVAAYRRCLDLHIAPYLGWVKLSQLSVAAVRKFEDDLTRDGRSRITVRTVRTSLGTLLADAQEQGLVARNVVRELKRGKKRKAERRERGKLKVGVHIPTPDEVKAMLAAAQGRWRPFLLVAVFTGLRASELRGLRWADVDLGKAELYVRQRADRYHTIGWPKSEAGERTVPLAPQVLSALREWRLACPKGPLDLVFPNTQGKIESHSAIIARGLVPAQLAAGVTRIEKDADGKVKLDEGGKPIWRAKYTGLHALRHFFASWCINPKSMGGR